VNSPKCRRDLLTSTRGALKSLGGLAASPSISIGDHASQYCLGRQESQLDWWILQKTGRVGRSLRLAQRE
jgi:hypothetical protein